jgi:RNA polymerase sigma factor (sigma-70 family)
MDQEIQSLLAVAQGDRAAFASLYDRYSAALYGVVLKMVREVAVAEEVLQDSFVKIWRGAANYDPDKGRPFTWMVNVARNTAIDRMRTKAFQQDAQIQRVDKHVYRIGERDTERHVDGIGMDRVLGALKEDSRSLIEMAYYQGFSQQEIADRTGLPLGTVKSRMRSALMHLREVLQPEQ